MVTLYKTCPFNITDTWIPTTPPLLLRVCLWISYNFRNNTSSYMGTTARCGLWPVEQYPSIFFLSATNSLHLLTPSTWRSHSTSSFHPFLGLPLLLVPSSFWVNIFLGILSSSIQSRWPNQLILCPFILFTIFSPLLISSSSRFVRLLRSPFSYLGPYILLNIFLSKTSRACSSFFVNVHASAPYDTIDLISVLYNIILVALDKSRLLKRLIAAK